MPNNDEKTDVVYFLGNGSPKGNWEIRHSMRSFTKNFKDLGRFYVVGYLPHWIDPEMVGGPEDTDKPVIHIKTQDDYKKCKDANLNNKMAVCATLPELSETFIRSSDDQLLLQKVSTEDFKPFILEPEQKVAEFILAAYDAEEKSKNRWGQRMHRTHLKLKSRGCSGHNYEGHIPYPIKKSKVRSILGFDYGNGNGYTVNTLYFNSSHSPKQTGKHPLLKFPTTTKIGRKVGVRFSIHGEGEDREAVASGFTCNLFCSFSDGALKNKDFTDEVETRFSTPLNFERDKT